MKNEKQKNKKTFICELCGEETPIDCEGGEPNTCAMCVPLDCEICADMPQSKKNKTRTRNVEKSAKKAVKTKKNGINKPTTAKVLKYSTENLVCYYNKDCDGVEFYSVYEKGEDETMTPRVMVRCGLVYVDEFFPRPEVDYMFFDEVKEILTFLDSLGEIYG